MLFEIATKVENIALYISTVKCVIEAIRDATNYSPHDPREYAEGLGLMEQELERQNSELLEISKALMEMNATLKKHGKLTGKTIAENEQ